MAAKRIVGPLHEVRLTYYPGFVGYAPKTDDELVPVYCYRHQLGKKFEKSIQPFLERNEVSSFSHIALMVPRKRVKYIKPVDFGTEVFDGS